MTAKQQPRWFLKKYEPDDTQRDSVSGEFFKNTRLESVVREAIQNSLDARPKGSKNPAVVRIYYSGPEAAVDGGKYAAQFRGETIDKYYSDGESGLKNRPSSSEKCEFLAIEDFNTTGLTGDVTKRPTKDELENDRVKGNYYNFFFRENRSDKAGAGALGSWGAGKIMFMKASRLRTAFTLSVRDDAVTPCFLAGRAVLNSLTIGNDTYAPDYWFGVEEPSANADEREMRKRPITDAAAVDAFAKLFHLTRGKSLGTSVVIPYLDVQDEDGETAFSLENIVCAVVKNFLLAILDGELEVKVETGSGGNVVEIIKGNVSAARKFLPIEPAAKVMQVTREHFDLAAKAFSPDLPPAQSINLKHVSPNLKPVWNDDIFAGLELKALKKILNAGEPLLFKIPLTVFEKDGTSKKTHTDTFFVALVRSQAPKQFRTGFYRVGLLIDDASSRSSFTGVVSLVKIENRDLAKLLVASEPPSHNQWDQGAERVKNGYVAPSAPISFVKDAVGEILGRIEAADQEPDQNVLIGTFGIPIEDEQEPQPPKPTPTPDNPAPTPEPPGPDPEPPAPPFIPEEFLRLDKLQSKIGFTISMKADRVSEKGYPVKCPFRMGYAPFTKSSWSPFDFKLDDKATIKIELESPDQSDVVNVDAIDNFLTLTVKKPGAFRLYVTGFDENRDLEVSKMRYVYPEEAKGEE